MRLNGGAPRGRADFLCADVSSITLAPVWPPLNGLVWLLRLPAEPAWLWHRCAAIVPGFSGSLIRHPIGSRLVLAGFHAASRAAAPGLSPLAV